MSYVVSFRGKPACPCLAEWLPVFERMLLLRGVVRESLDIAQLIGGAEASGGTHTTGGAFDVWQHDPVTQAIGREMGAATWNRIPPYWSGSPHSHGVLNGCPHNTPARYQIDALEDGYSGLGKGGRGSRDYGPGPRQLRTWREGIAWANRQMEDDMPYTDWPQEDRDALVRDVVNGLQRRDLFGDERDDTPADAFRKIAQAKLGRIDDIEAKVDQIIGALGSVDAPKAQG